MELTATEKELYDYCRNNEFLTAGKLETFRQRLTQEGNLNSLVYALEDFIPAACPKCKASGTFKWHFLGKLTHPSCSESWYVPPGTYSGRQLKAAFRTGRNMGGEMSVDAEKKGEKGIFRAYFRLFYGRNLQADICHLDDANSGSSEPLPEEGLIKVNNLITKTEAI